MRVGGSLKRVPDLAWYDDVRGSAGMSIGMGSDTRASSGADDRAADLIDTLFRTYASRVYGYVRLRAPADLVDDVVADTFLTAWRLRDSVPAEPLPWLLVIARNALANRQRSQRRGARLVIAMATVEQFARQGQSADDAVLERESALAALARLGDDEREAILLTAWDGLSPHDAARVAGCSARTFARRLQRARRQLHTALGLPAARTSRSNERSLTAHYSESRAQKDQS